jgi:DNA-binding CsgD family transcriptional regulator
MAHDQLKPSVGILVLDAQLRLVHYTVEAARILAYPKQPCDNVPLDVVLPATRCQVAVPSRPAPESVLEFSSGRRRYRCRAFLLDSDRRDSNGNGRDPVAVGARSFAAKGYSDYLQPRIVVVLERVVTHQPDITRWSEAFQLTNRECETVKLLLKGLTSKEIADQMSISPNTVKSFLKLVMAKVGATNRTGIIAKILERAS